ncbi:MAG: class I tRNA ligase family protein [Carbonactinosporaceae bacterium]
MFEAPTLRLARGALPIIGRARIYVCGITPYDTTHLGHAATFVWTDLVVRLLRHAGVEVDLCRNVTDVDDVLTAAAQRAGSPYDSFAAVQEFHFQQDMAALNVRRPTLEPRAHNYVRQVVSLAGVLLEAGQAYVRDGSVYFRGGGVPGRAGLERETALRLAEEYGDRPGEPVKDDAFDVALWQASREGEPAWPSPWGPGRPGWHAECAAMVLATYGPALDLHGGGADLRFPHHAYESAMAEAATGVRPFARAWMHVGTVRIDGAKMAKSAGNLVLVSDVLKEHSPAALRLLLLDRRWDADWDYTRGGLDAAEARLQRLYAAASRGGGGQAEAAAVGALLDDLDVPAALEIAEEAGGQAARTVLAVMALT